MPVITREEILKRLPFIFPVGMPNRNLCVSEVAAGAIFTMFKTGVVNPRHIFRENENEASKTLHRKKPLYIALTHGLIPAGAVKILPGVHPNAFKPKYYLEKEFALLFKKKLNKNDLLSWQKKHFTHETNRHIALIHEAAQNLPPRQKKIFQMTRYENCFRIEAADKLQLPIRTINNELRNAIRFIRKQIRNENLPPDGKQSMDGPRRHRNNILLAPDPVVYSIKKEGVAFF